VRTGGAHGDAVDMSAVTLDDTTLAAEGRLGMKAAPRRKRKLPQHFPAEEVSQPTVAAHM
jgi:hypothetical protein